VTALHYVYFSALSGLAVSIFHLALDDGNVDEAHHIHISLMVDFVAEVSNCCLLFMIILALWTDKCLICFEEDSSQTLCKYIALKVCEP